MHLIFEFDYAEPRGIGLWPVTWLSKSGEGGATLSNGTVICAALSCCQHGTSSRNIQYFHTIFHRIYVWIFKIVFFGKALLHMKTPNPAHYYTCLITSRLFWADFSIGQSLALNSRPGSNPVSNSMESTFSRCKTRLQWRPGKIHRIPSMFRGWLHRPSLWLEKLSLPDRGGPWVTADCRVSTEQSDCTLLQT